MVQVPKALNTFGDSAEVGSQAFYQTVIAKLLFTNPTHLPSGIPEVRRESDQEMDKLHTREAYTKGYGHLAQTGRVRPGRTDTGIHFIPNIQNIHAGFLIQGLSNVGYRVTGCHWFFKPANPKSSDKYVVVVNMQVEVGLEGFKLVELPREAIEQRRALSRTCWNYCHGWANPDRTITLNFGGRMPDATPRHAVVVREGRLIVAQTTAFVNEENE